MNALFIVAHTSAGSQVFWNAATAIVLVVMAVMYARGARGKYAIAFYLGWASVAIALLSPLDDLSDILFSAHMAQHEILMLISAPLIIMGRPLIAFLWAFSPEHRAKIAAQVRRPIVTAAWHRLTGPLTVLILHAVVLWVWHVPAMFEAALHNETIHVFQHLGFFVTAALFWWALIHGRYGKVGYGVGVAYVFATAMHTQILGALLTFGRRVWYPTHALRTGAHALEDQQLAGIVMWIPFGVIFVVIGLALFAAWLGEAERRVRFSSADNLLMVIVAVTLLSSCAQNKTSLLYVTNERSGTITVIDTISDKVVDTINVGARPRGLALTRDRLFAALTDLPGRDGKIAPGRKGIAEIDRATGRVMKVFDGGSDPEVVACNSDGSRLFVSNEDAGTATIIDTKTGRPLSTLIVGVEPEGVTTSPDDRWVYVTAETSNTVSAIDPKKGEVVATFMVDSRPRASAFSPDGKTAWVTSEVGGSISVIDTATHTVKDVIDFPSGVKPVGIAVTKDGSTVYVANGHANSITIIDAKTHRIAGTIAVGKRPWHVALAPDDSKLYAANGLSNDVSVVDLRQKRVVATIAAGDGPWGLAIQ